ncbi:SanA/YdcF family protein [Foetidibacter luteolus]|uniref:SanA/YdcF family protein n=1 Tax=Foetidibacter luteolus TaxID=2608880 RepID=UPI00129BA961|nr:ElyC/SanA/YdcF family protein [Foetidibacter luteolus]
MLKKRIIIIIACGLAVLIVIVLICNSMVVNAAKGKTYTNAADLPYRRVGLLLGVPKYTTYGKPNQYYQYRIEAAAVLMRLHKIKYLLVSGDSSAEKYNEPWSMRADLLKAGVDSAVIFLDCNSLRTFDSVVRLKEIFGQDSVTIISQLFHNERAIYTAEKTGVNAIGFNAADVDGYTGAETYCREKLARVKLMIDIVLGYTPGYMGKRGIYRLINCCQ